MEREFQRTVCLYDLYRDADYNVRRVRQIKKGSRKKKPNPNKKLKCGIEVPHNVVRSKGLDEIQCDTLWKDSMKKEVYSLMESDYF